MLDLTFASVEFVIRWRRPFALVAIVLLAVVSGLPPRAKYAGSFGAYVHFRTGWNRHREPAFAILTRQKTKRCGQEGGAVEHGVDQDGDGRVSGSIEDEWQDQHQRQRED